MSHDMRSILLAAAFRAEAERYDANAQPTEAWLLRWAAAVCEEPDDRVQRRITESW
jgi:hypothetical protein